jgi:hypothetical protein
MLQFGNTTGMIEMHVRIKNKLYVLNAESQLANVLSDQYRRFSKRTVDKHVSCRRRNQDRAQAVRADVVRVAVDLEWLLGGIPFHTRRTLRCAVLAMSTGPSDAEDQPKAKPSIANPMKFTRHS